MRFGHGKLLHSEEPLQLFLVACGEADIVNKVIILSASVAM